MMAEHLVSSFKKVKSSLPGESLPWLAQARQKAIDRFALMGFPTTKLEAWKHTDVSPIGKIPLTSLNPTPANLDRSWFEKILPQEYQTGCRLVFVNGSFMEPNSHTRPTKEKIQIKNLRDILEKEPDQAKSLLLDLNGGEHPFEHLNTAFFGEGAFIKIPKDVQVKDPIFFIYLSLPQNEQSAIHVRNLILAEPGSQAKIIEIYLGPTKDRYFTNTVTKIYAAQNAKISHIKIQKEALKAFHTGFLGIKQDRFSHVESYSLSFGGNLVRNDIYVSLNEEGAECTLNGLYMGKDKQHVDHHTTIDHVQPHCTSKELYKGILDEQSHGVFRGRIIVREQAQKTNAYQLNRNLLLSEKALADTTPQLEIFADDVKCSHGATIGKLREEELFYLRSRGLEYQAAQRLLIHGFAKEVIEPIKIPQLENDFEQTLSTYFSS